MSIRGKPGRPKLGETGPRVDTSIDIVGGYIPVGVEEDDTTREVIRQIQNIWRRLTDKQKRVIILFEASPDPAGIASRAGFSGKGAAGKVEEELQLPLVRQVLHLRSALVGSVMPTAMSKRLLTSFVLGTHPVQQTAATFLQAIKLLALLNGEIEPEVKADDLEAGAVAGVTRDENDRIMRETMGSANVADVIRARSQAAAAERAIALEVETPEATPEPVAAAVAEVVKVKPLSKVEQMLAAGSRRKA